MKKNRVTFADIAAYTNFSKTTISRYFNNPDSLTLENQQKIADALVALDYKENKVGRILASGQTEVENISQISSFEGSSLFPVPMQEIIFTPAACARTASDTFAATVSTASTM